MSGTSHAIQLNSFTRALSTLADGDDVRLNERGTGVAGKWSRFEVAFCDFFRSPDSIAHRKSLAVEAYRNAVRAEHGQLMLSAIDLILNDDKTGAGTKTLTARKIAEVNQFIAKHGGQHWWINRAMIVKASKISVASLGDSMLLAARPSPTRNQIFKQCIAELKTEATQLDLGITDREFEIFGNFYNSDLPTYSEDEKFIKHHNKLNNLIETALCETALKKSQDPSITQHELTYEEIHATAGAAIKETLRQNLYLLHRNTQTNDASLKALLEPALGTRAYRKLAAAPAHLEVLRGQMRQRIDQLPRPATRTAMLASQNDFISQLTAASQAIDTLAEHLNASKDPKAIFTEFCTEFTARFPASATDPKAFEHFVNLAIALNAAQDIDQTTLRPAPAYVVPTTLRPGESPEARLLRIQLRSAYRRRFEPTEKALRAALYKGLSKDVKGQPEDDKEQPEDVFKAAVSDASLLKDLATLQSNILGYTAMPLTPRQLRRRQEQLIQQLHTGSNAFAACVGKFSELTREQKVQAYVSLIETLKTAYDATRGSPDDMMQFFKLSHRLFIARGTLDTNLVTQLPESDRRFNSLDAIGADITEQLKHPQAKTTSAGRPWPYSAPGPVSELVTFTHNLLTGDEF